MSLKLIVMVCLIMVLFLWLLTLLGAISFASSGWIPFFAVLLLAIAVFAPGGA